MDMKPDDIKELLLRSVTDELTDEERSILDGVALPGYEFKPDFRSKVMNVVGKAGMRIMTGREKLRSFDTAFLRIAITGVAAIVILALTLLLDQGSLSYDTLLGIDNNMDDSLISLLVD